MTFNPNNPHDLKSLPPIADFETTSILKALNSTSREVAELKGYCSSLPNPMALMKIILFGESIESSSIEGIHTTLESVLKNQILPESEQKAADEEVSSYLDALYWGMKNVSAYSLSTRLILGIHEQLLRTSVGFRKQQNAIKNLRTGEIIYTPPIASKVDKLIQNLENFANYAGEEGLDPLIKVAITHYQFEAIHPFGDGNGRTGRIVLALQLVQENLLDHPVLYTSAYLNKNRSKYYKSLKAVSETGDWDTYILFILEGFRVQAIYTKRMLFKLKAEYEETKNKIRDNHSKMNAVETTNHIFSNPLTTPTEFAKALGIHYQTAGKHLAELKEAGIFFDSWIGKNHLYWNKSIIDMMNNPDPE